MPQTLKNAAGPELENPAAQTLCEPAGRVPGARARTLIQPTPQWGPLLGEKQVWIFHFFGRLKKGDNTRFEMNM